MLNAPSCSTLEVWGALAFRVTPVRRHTKESARWEAFQLG